MDNDLLLKENPFALTHVKLVRLFLWTIGAWPGKMLGEHEPWIIRYHRVHGPVQGFINTLGELFYLFKFFKDITFYSKGQCYIVTFLSVLTTARTALPSFKQYSIITTNFFNKFHLIHYKHKGEYDLSIYTIIDKISYYFTVYLMAMMVGGMILFNLSPWYLNYKNGAFSGHRKENTTLELAVYHAYPGFDPNDHFWFMTIYNLYLSYMCATSVCSIDLLLSLMVFQIIGHIQILRHNLENVPKPKSSITVAFNLKNGELCHSSIEMFNAEENESVRKKLIEYINHHKMIVSFTQDMSDFFGPMLALNYSFHLVSCCLLLLECSQGDPAALFRFGPLTVIIFGQLIQISVTFEVVGTVSEKLKDSVYHLPWECMNVRNRRTTCILLNRVQTPITVNAMGLTSVGVTTMAGILKTTFSYFTFLRSMDL